MKAQIILNRHFETGEIDKRIYGSFIEHLGRAVYGGIYEPEHPSANDQGFREDVLELVRQLNVPIVRYPGGNFVSGYRWEDGTGDKSKRPRRLELAWRTTETNQVGIDEFQEWARQANSEVLMAVNLGTRGPQEAMDLVEYCNLDTDTHYARLRRENGFEKPFGIKTWCLGNEMDGIWQIGHKNAEEYGRAARETAKLMKWVDPGIELVACGSSHYNMDTFGEWELKVLDHTYDLVDYISLHQYYSNHLNNTKDFLGRAVHMDSFIKSVIALCDAVKAKKHSPKTVNLSFDEWNVWYHSSGDTFEDWAVAPGQLQDIYNFEDAVLVGDMLITLQNNCDRVKIACMAQLVNVIAPIMTENGGSAWAQTIYYPYMYSSVYGRGKVLRGITRCDSYETTDNYTVPYVSCSAVHNEEKRELILYCVNRSLEEEARLELTLEGFAGAKLKRHVELYHEDLKRVNTAEDQAVVPVEREPEENPLLKKHSWNMLVFEY